MGLVVAILLAQVVLSDEGGAKKAVKHLNCVGAGITCSSSSTYGTITVPGGGGSVPDACSAGQATTSNGSELACTSTLTASDVVCGGTCVADAEIAAVSGAKVSGAVATATACAALASNPAPCSANNFVTDAAADGTLTCAQPSFSNLSGAADIAQGGTTETASTEDAVLVGASTTDWAPKVLPDCDDTGGNHLNYDQGTNAFSCGTSGGGSGAPTDAEYWTGAANGTLSAEKNLGALSTGLVVNTAGVPSAYAGTSCSNQFPRSLNASGAATCASVSMSADVTGTLPFANGGNGITRLGGDVAIAVNASYVDVMTVAGAAIGNSKNVSLDFRAVYIATATTVGMQFRVLSADNGYAGTCTFITWGISGTAASATAIETDIIAIGTNPADTGAAAACATAPCIVDVECALTSDASAGDVVLQAQLETGTSSAPIKAGSSFYRLITN